MEIARKEDEAKEAVLAANLQNNKKKLLTDLAAREAENEEAVKRLQHMKDKEREVLFGSLSSGKLLCFDSFKKSQVSYFRPLDVSYFISNGILLLRYYSASLKIALAVCGSLVTGIRLLALVKYAHLCSRNLKFIENKLSENSF